MAITVLSDVILPTSLLTSGVRGKQMRNNTRSEASNGSAIININWSKTLRQYELGCVPMTVAQWQALEGLHEVTEGGAYGSKGPLHAGHHQGGHGHAHAHDHEHDHEHEHHPHHHGKG